MNMIRSECKTVLSELKLLSIPLENQQKQYSMRHLYIHFVCDGPTRVTRQWQYEHTIWHPTGTHICCLLNNSHLLLTPRVHTCLLDWCLASSGHLVSICSFTSRVALFGWARPLVYIDYILENAMLISKQNLNFKKGK